jgi:glycosyltransferase involved in cell wall biosynthesis
MRILHVIPTLNKGGAERYCADVCAELSGRPDIEVLLLSMSPSNKYSFITEKINYRVCNSRVLPSISGRAEYNTDEYDQIVREFKPDVIHSHLFWAELLTREKPLPEVAYVTHCQNNMPEFRNVETPQLFRKSTWTKQFEKRWIIKRYKACKNNFIVISKDTEAYYHQVLPKELRNITMLHHAIDFEKFNKANVDRSDDLSKIKLVYVARFAIYKNHQFLIDVVLELKQRGYEVSLDFLGDGECMEEVRTKVIKYNLEKEINFAGVIDDVELYLSKANLYVHPAYYEPFGLVLIEAMAAGLPVVCLDGKGNRDLIEQGENGFMVFEQNPQLFADRILDIFGSKENYSKMSKFCVEYARSFDIKNHTDKLIGYYKSILK